jgi:hypothetical protein
MAKQLKQYTRVSDINVGDAEVLPVAAALPRETPKEMTSSVTGGGGLGIQVAEKPATRLSDVCAFLVPYTL